LVLFGVPVAAQQVDITVRPPTAKTASVAYTWGLAASVVPAQVTMAVAETRQVRSRPVGWVAAHGLRHSSGSPAWLVT
jgi:hypothetical protein